MLEKIDNCLNSQEFNGCILVAQDSEILINKGYGYADYENKIANDSKTKFKIASLSKAFTAAAVLQLSEKNYSIYKITFLNLYLIGLMQIK